ncbi:hypothetical protein Bbelb_286410 [Branchiostoma belcheri]|nr:hypothetical protein Bbelb_286410 [Branchiostoma belcheri]
MASHLRPYEVFWTKDVTDEENSLVHVPGVTDVGNKRPQKKAPGRRSRDLGPRMPSPVQHSTPERDDDSAKHSGKEAEDNGKEAEDSVIKQQKEKIMKNGNLDSKKPSLKDLRIEDKKRVANLIKELAKVGEEKEKAVETLQAERQTYDQKLHQLEQEHQKTLQAIQDQYQHLAKERDHILSRAAMAEQQYQETQSLLTLYQRQITEQQEMVNERLSESLNELLSSPRRLSPPQMPESTQHTGMPASTVGFTPPQRLNRGRQDPIPSQRYADLYTPQVNMVQPGAEVSSRGISHTGPTTLMPQGEIDLRGSYRPKERTVPSRDVIYSDNEDTVYTGKYAVHYYLDHPERIQSNLPPGVLPSQQAPPPQYNPLIPPADPDTHTTPQSSVISSVHSAPSSNQDPASLPMETFLPYSGGQQSSSQYSSADFQPLKPEPDFDSQTASQKRTESHGYVYDEPLLNGHAQNGTGSVQVHRGMGVVHDGKGGLLSRQLAWEQQRDQLMAQKQRLVEEQDRLRRMLAAQEDQLSLKRAQLHRQQVRHKGRLQFFEEMGRFPSDSSVASSVRSSLASVDRKLPRAPVSHPRQPLRTSKEPGRRKTKFRQEFSAKPRVDKPSSRYSVEQLDWDHTYDYKHPTYIQTNMSQEARGFDRSSRGLGYRDRLPRYDEQPHVDTDGTSDQVSSHELSPPSTKYPPSEPGFKSPTTLTKPDTTRDLQKQQVETPVTEPIRATTAEKGVGGETVEDDGKGQERPRSRVSDAGSIKGFASLYPGEQKRSPETVAGTTADMATSPAYTESSVQTDGGTVSVGTSPVHFSQTGTLTKKRPASRESTRTGPDDASQTVLSGRRSKSDRQKSTGSFLSSLVDIVDLVDPSLGSHSGHRNDNRASYHGNKSSRPNSRQRPFTAPSSEKKGLMGYGRNVPSGREGGSGYDRNVPFAREGVSGYDRTVPFGREGEAGYDRTVPLGREGVTGYEGGISPDLFADDEDDSITEQESRILEEVFFLK